jgi:hypothetical protein
MSTTRNLLAVAVSVTVCSQAQALLSVNVLQDNTTVPGWVINTFTADSDADLLSALASSNLSTGSMLQVPGFFLDKRSNGPGDSFININGDPNTISGLGAGDVGDPTPRFDSTGIAMTWLNIRGTDIGTGMHLATLTFSDDAVGGLQFWVGVGQRILQEEYSILDGFVNLSSSYLPPPPPPPPPNDPPIDTNPLPDPNPGPGNDPNPGPGLPGDLAPDGGNNPIPEPAGLGLLGLCAAVIGGLHRRRLGADAT